MSGKQIGIKEKEQNRRKSVAGMISSEVVNAVASQENTAGVKDHLPLDNGSEQETIESLKRQLAEAKAALKGQPGKKARVKDTRVNLLMYKDVYEALKKKCKKNRISVNDCMNQLAEQWVYEQE